MLTIDPAVFRPDAISPETAAFNRWLEGAMAEMPAIHEVPPEVTRQARAEGRGIFPHGGPLGGSDWREIPTGAGLARVTLPDEAPTGVFIHIHGGGWTIGAPEQYDHWCQHLAERAGCAVVSVKYRLAPEHPWPACADDCEAAAVWAMEVFGPEIRADRFAIGGESAGAHLAAVTLLRLRARALHRPIRGALLHYGCFDVRMTPSMANWGATPLILSTPSVDWFAGNLTAGNTALRGDPALSPLLADLGDMPPALFQCGTLDPLLDDTLFMAARWLAAGGEAEAKLYPGGVHAFDMFDIPIAEEAREAGADFLRRMLE